MLNYSKKELNSSSFFVVALEISYNVCYYTDMIDFDEKVVFKNFFFHGLTCECLSLQELELCLDKFRRIVYANAILSRKQIIKVFGKEYFEEAKEKYCTVNWNGDDYVCLCKFLTDCEGCTFTSEAYRLFCRDGLALIIDKAVLNDAELDRFGQFQDGEIRIKDKIDFKYVKGILIDRLNPKSIAEHKKNLRNFTREETEEWLKDIYADGINQVFEVLKKYNLNLPVYSSSNGKIIRPLNEVLNEIYCEETTLSQ